MVTKEIAALEKSRYFYRLKPRIQGDFVRKTIQFL